MLEIILRKTMPNGSAEEKVLYSSSDTVSDALEKEIIHFPNLDIHLREQSATSYGKTIPLGFSRSSIWSNIRAGFILKSKFTKKYGNSPVSSVEMRFRM